jgi:hypothetical protein
VPGPAGGRSLLAAGPRSARDCRQRRSAPPGHRCELPARPERAEERGYVEGERQREGASWPGRRPVAECPAGRGLSSRAAVTQTYDSQSDTQARFRPDTQARPAGPDVFRALLYDRPLHDFTTN